MFIGSKNQCFLFQLVILVLVVTFLTPNNVHASDTRADILRASNKEKMGHYVRSRFFERMKKPFTDNDKRKKMLIIGDSHAQDFYNAMLENNMDQRYQISTRRIPAICGLYLGWLKLNKRMSS